MSGRVIRSRMLLGLAIALPLTNWLVVGGGTVEFLPLMTSAVAWCWPAVLTAGWTSSVQRSSLARLIYRSSAGRVALILPELLLPVLAGAVPSLVLCMLQYRSDMIPWQLWTVVPFTSLLAVSVTMLLERYLKEPGHALNILAFFSQASSSGWTGSGLYQILVPQGYVLWVLEWMKGNRAAFHGDIYAFFAVLAGTGLTIVTVRALYETKE
jgi:hypothetical protein